MRRSKTSPSARSIEQSLKRDQALGTGSSPPFYGSWASSVDYIKSLKTLTGRLESVELSKVAKSYSQKLLIDRCTKDFHDQKSQNDEQESKYSMASTSEATEFLARALSGTSRQDRYQGHREEPRSPYDCDDGLKTKPERHQPSHDIPLPAIHSLAMSPCISTSEITGGDNFPKLENENPESPVYELEIDSVDLGSRPTSSNVSRNFSASECSMFYSPSRCSGLSSSTNQSNVSNFKLPSVCMMSDYSAENFQNRRLGVSSRLRSLKHTDYDLAKSNRQLFIAKNGGDRSCLLASQKQHSNLRSACPPGTNISKDDLAKYRRLRNCDPNLASRELVCEFQLHSFLFASFG
jgi:hypothetical protein